MPRPIKKRASAWRAAARMLIHQPWRYSGLCSVLDQLHTEGKITPEMKLKMEEQIDDHIMIGERHIGAWLDDSYDHTTRIPFCELLALEAQDEDAILPQSRANPPAAVDWSGAKIAPTPGMPDWSDDAGEAGESQELIDAARAASREPRVYDSTRLPTEELTSPALGGGPNWEPGPKKKQLEEYTVEELADGLGEALAILSDISHDRMLTIQTSLRSEQLRTRWERS